MSRLPEIINAADLPKTIYQQANDILKTTNENIDLVVLGPSLKITQDLPIGKLDTPQLSYVGELLNNYQNRINRVWWILTEQKPNLSRELKESLDQWECQEIGEIVLGSFKPNEGKKISVLATSADYATRNGLYHADTPAIIIANGQVSSRHLKRKDETRTSNHYLKK
jgi:hypothetical protein